jgi:uncharacterized delta-60 repeat protein
LSTKELSLGAVSLSLALALARAPRAEAQGCIVTTPIGGANDEPRAIALQADGKVVVAGFSFNGLDEDFAVVRYNPDLSLDATFGAGGIVTTNIGPGDDRALDVAVQGDGKIVVVGSVFNGSFLDVGVVRYDPNGSLDTTFGGTGVVVTSVGPLDDEATSVAIQSDGRLVVAGFSQNGADYDFALLRYDATGSLDGSFDLDGMVTADFGAGSDLAEDVAVQVDGKIVVGGYSYNAADYDFAAARYLPDGTLDGSFDVDGRVTTSIGLSNDVARAMVIQSDGRIVLAGSSFSGANDDYALVRYNSDGSLDTTFDGDGKVVSALNAGNESFHAVAIQADGKILAAGRTETALGYRVASVRYNVDGSLDLSYDDNGKERTDIGAGDDVGYGVAIEPGSGEIFVAGATANGASNDFAVLRYESDGSLDCSRVSLHPTGPGSVNAFTTASGCAASWDCVNDQPGNLGFGAAAGDDGIATYLQDAIGQTNSEAFSLDDATVPAGATISAIEIEAQVGAGAGPSPKNVRLSYQRMGFDPVPVLSPAMAVTASCCLENVDWFLGGLGWSPAMLDALEIGIVHESGGQVQVSQLYVTVRFVAPAAQVNYRSIGVRPDYGTVGPEGAGTSVSAVNGFEVVTGASTAWKSSNRGRGDRITIEGIPYTVLSVDSETRLTLTSPFTGATGSGKPYSISRELPTLQAWESAIEGNLVLDNREEVGIAYNDGAFTETLIIDGSRTDGEHEIVLTADGPNRHLGIPGMGVVVDNPSAVDDAIQVSDDYVTLEWLEVRGGAGVGGVHVEFLGTSNDVVLRNLLVHDVPVNGFHLNDPNMQVLAYDNIFFNVALGIEISTVLSPTGQVELFNNTVAFASDRGIAAIGPAPNVTLVNNIAAASGVQDFDVPGLNGASRNNLGTDGTGASHSSSGGLDVAFASIQFVNPAAGNLHIFPGSAARDAGAILSATFTSDVDGAVRPTSWDIGADEAEAPGSFRLYHRSIGTAPSYGDGSVTVSTGSSVVTGSGTLWLTANRGAGDRITIQGQDYYVLSVDSESQITLESPYAGFPGTWTYSISRAFATLQAWEDARGGDLVLENRREVGVVYNDGGPFTGVEIEGSTTDETRFLTLTVAPRNRHSGFAGAGAYIDGLNSPWGEVLVGDDFTVVEGLEVRGVRGGAAIAGVRVRDAESVRLSYLLLHDNRMGFRLSGSGGSSVALQNSILYRNDLDGIEGDEITDSVAVENCTVFGNGDRGIDDASGTFFRVTNTIAAGNAGGDFDMPGGVLSYSLSSDGTAAGPGSLPFRAPTDISNPPPGDWVIFRSLVAGNEDLHLHLVAENDAVDTGTTLSSGFFDDIDRVSRTGLWDLGADEASAAAAGASLSSEASQSFVVGSPPTPAAQITVSDLSIFGGVINAVDDIRIRIPAGFHMRWDNSVATVALGGSAASKVSPSVKAYEDSDATVVLDVLEPFLFFDTVTIDGLKFSSFAAPSAQDNLELETGNDDLVSADDDKNIAIGPAAGPTLSSAYDQYFLVGSPPASASTMFVTEGTQASVTALNEIRVRIPPAVDMKWDASIGSALVSGPAAGKVAPSVSYEDFDRTLVLNVLQSFAPGEYVEVSGLAFWDFATPSPSANLELETGNDDMVTDLDDKYVTLVASWDLQVLAARATNLEVKLEWLNPSAGACDSVWILARTDQYPTGPGDLSARVVDIRPCTLGAKDSFTDLVPNDVTQFYAAWVYDSVSGDYSFGKLVKARAFDSVPGPVKWAYSTGASSMAPPGLRFQGTESYVYVVSNDSILHSLNGGDAGGDWPLLFRPFLLGAPAQARPPVVSFPVGGAMGAAFLGSQDGAVYAVDTESGALEWSRTIATMVQAAPAGNFQAFDPTAFNLILVGTRNSSLPNSLEALDVDTGTPVWSFTNSLAQGGDGKAIGIISGGASIDYVAKRVYFASRVHPSGSSHTLWCVDFSSGLPVRCWSLPLGNIDGSPVLYGGAVYVGTNAGSVRAFDTSGNPLWSLALGDGPIKGFVFPQYGSSNVLVSTNGKVWSIASGAVNPGWPVAIPSPSIPLYVPGTMKVLVGSGNGFLYQMDAATPTPVKSVLIGDGTAAVGAPTMDLRKFLLYMGTDDGIVYAVRFPLP